MKKSAVLIVVCFFSNTIFRNVSAQNVLNGFYVKEHVPTKKIIQDASVVERDVMWEKRIWRIIDNREKINFPLYYPLQPIEGEHMSLWDIIRHHLVNEIGSLTPYKDFNELKLSDFGGDQFLYPVSTSDPEYVKKVSELINVLGEEPDRPYQVENEFGVIVDSVKEYNPDGSVKEYEYPPRDTFKIESKDIVAWEIKEDCFFDKQRSVMEYRIIGIAPIVQNIDPVSKEVTGHHRLMWLYFPELRYILQNYYVFNRMNSAQEISFDDLFRKRQFNSYIKKESNIYNRNISDYTSGVDALIESEKIKQDVLEFEHDVWDL